MYWKSYNRNLNKEISISQNLERKGWWNSNEIHQIDVDIDFIILEQFLGFPRFSIGSTIYMGYSQRLISYNGPLCSGFGDIRKLMFTKFCDISSHKVIKYSVLWHKKFFVNVSFLMSTNFPQMLKNPAGISGNIMYIAYRRDSKNGTRWTTWSSWLSQIWKI